MTPQAASGHCLCSVRGCQFSFVYVCTLFTEHCTRPTILATDNSTPVQRACHCSVIWWSSIFTHANPVATHRACQLRTTTTGSSARTNSCSRVQARWLAPSSPRSFRLHSSLVFLLSSLVVCQLRTHLCRWWSLLFTSRLLLCSFTYCTVVGTVVTSFSWSAMKKRDTITVQINYVMGFVLSTWLDPHAFQLF